MTDSPKLPGVAGEPDRVVNVRSAGRRRLLQAGISAAPVVMTIVSRPVLANNDVPQQCFSPSGFTSLNQSGQGGGGTCSGRTPGFWKQSQHFGWWPAGYYPVAVPGHPATTFCAVFPSCSVYSGKTLLEVLSTGGGPPNDVGRHIVAALLNTLTGLVPPIVLSVPMILEIWRQYIDTGGGTTGHYSTSSGGSWYHTQIVAYLQTTMPI